MTGIVILAAGASVRLGRAKQTLMFDNKTLLNHTIDTAIKANLGPVIVVLGANENEILAQTRKEKVTLIKNNNWQSGMSSSIREGVTALIKDCPDVENVILMVCDQPFVNEKILTTLLQTKYITGKPIVACTYKNTVGVPALFDRQFFGDLISVEGETGGKKILLQHLSSVASIPFEKGIIDIDTEADYEALNNQGEA